MEGAHARRHPDPLALGLWGFLLDQVDVRYLERALELAENGVGLTAPNPIVGAVIVRDGSVLGEGWHAGAGLDHAEVAAIRDSLVRSGLVEDAAHPELDWGVVRSVCAGATMYVTLEPCCTQGRTPPCTVALVNSAFERVVVAAIDPSPLVDGRGLDELRQAGMAVEVAEGAIAHRAKRQNNALRKTVAQGLPFVVYKYAMTLDGRVATDCGDARWVSCPESRALVHRWRALSDAVVVGAGTARADDPTLTAREVGCRRQPLRVVVDPRCTLASDCRLAQTADEGPVLVVCSEQVSPERRAEVESWGVAIATVEVGGDRGLDPVEVCRVLAARDVQSVLLEGGPLLAGSWWDAGVIDKVAAFIATSVVSGREAHGPLSGPGAVSMKDSVRLHEVETQQVGSDILITGYTGGPF